MFHNFFTGKNKDLKTKFMSLLDEMCLGKKISIDGDNVTKVSKGEKRGREEGQGTDTASSTRPDHSLLSNLTKAAISSSNLHHFHFFSCPVPKGVTR